MRILGIDPGLQRTGWGIVAVEGNRLSFIDGGVIATESDAELQTRLHALHDGLSAIIARFTPHEAAIEETFVNKSGTATLKLGQARGALMLSLSLSGLPVAEYAANLVKKSVTGSGHAGKDQVSRMVQVLLPGCRVMKADAMDALAVAICHSQHRQMRQIKQGGLIGKLKGIVDSVDEGETIIDVHGVGYTVLCSSRLLAALAPGEATELVIETHVREDHIHLYGFETIAEREWFRLLTSVQRVGAKMALGILGAMPPEQIAHAIAARDNAAFSRISGIGPKLAERIVAELKDKVLKAPIDTNPSPDRKKIGLRAVGPVSPLDDAISALTHLGYSRSEAYAAASQAARSAGEHAKLDELIKQSLKELMA